MVQTVHVEAERVAARAAIQSCAGVFLAAEAGDADQRGEIGEQPIAVDEVEDRRFRRGQHRRHSNDESP